MNLGELRTYVRDLTGVYSTDLVSDSLLNRWINEAYFELARDRDWPWLTGTLMLPAIPQSSPILYVFETPATIRGVWFKKNANQIVPIPQRPHLRDIEANSPMYYAMESTTFMNVTPWQMISIGPTIKESGWILIDAAVLPAELTSDTQSPMFASQFHSILAYRAAIKLLTSQADDTPRAQAYAVELQALFEGMERLYLGAHDASPIQLGGDSLVVRRFVPWFRGDR